MKSFKFIAAMSAMLFGATGGVAQAAQILDTYNVQAYNGSTLVLSGSFSVLHDDPATVSVYWQTATLQSADLTLGSTHFTLANTGLFKNTSPISYQDPDLYQLYGKVGTGLGMGTGVGGGTDDFSLAFNPYQATAGNMLYATANPAISFAFASRVVLTFATGAVPEPATWGMMIVGFGLAGTAMRRRVRFAGVQAA